MEKKNYFENAQWIFVKDVPGDVCNTYFEYETSFCVENTENVHLFISASTLFAVYVNGMFVDCGQYADYEDYQAYDILDIKKFVKPGKNTLKIEHYVIGTNYFTHRIQIPGIIFALWEKDNCVLCSNEAVLSRKNTHFADGPMEHISGQLGYVFKYDACAEELPWQKSVLAGKEKQLYPRPIKKLVIEEETTGTLKTQGVYLSATKDATVGKRVYNAFLSTRTEAELLDVQENATHWQIPEDDMAEGVYFLLDMGQESVGFLNLDFEVPEDCEVLIGYGEHLEDLRVRSSIKARNFALLRKEG